jgi:putative ABC transport system permease protein
MIDFLNELKLAVRSLRRSPGFVAAATLSLALGIAVNSTIFAAIDAFLLRPFPYADPERLVQVRIPNDARGWDDAGVSYQEFLDYRSTSRTLELAAHTGMSYNLTDGDNAVRVEGSRSTGLFSLLGMPPAVGRTFLPEEEGSQNRVAVLSHRLWTGHYEGDSAAVGKTMLLDGEPYTIIGVMPATFRYPANTTDLWVPFQPDPDDTRKDRYFEMVGRLRGNESLEAANTEMRGISGRLEAEYPASNQGHGVNVIGLDRAIYDETFRQASLICTVAVAFVLLIACANVANLMLARGAVQGRDLAVRAALGAGRWRLARKLLAESLLIALAGGVLGLIFSFWGVRGLVGMLPDWVPRVENIAVNGRLLIYILGLSIISGLIFGLAPALGASRADIYSSLRETGRTGTPGAGHGRLRKSFVVAEISLALVLLIAAGLLVKASIRMQQVDLGFEPRGLLTARITLPATPYKDSSLVIPFYEQLIAGLRDLPGVTSAGLTSTLPLDGGVGTFYTIEGEPAPEPGQEKVVQFRGITPDYLETMGMPLRQGRPFTDQDRVGSPRVALVNEAMVRQHWPGKSPIGRRLVLSSGTYEIVGVVGDARDFGPDDATPILAFLPAQQRWFRSMSLVLRTGQSPAELAPAIRELIRSRDAGLPLYSLRTMEDLIEQSQGGDKVMKDLLAIFGGIALVLALLGVYGVMAYTVTQRTQEVGIRMALGADGKDIIRLIVRQGGTLALLGSVIGLGLALATAQALAVFLFGMSPFDLTVFGGVTAALLLAAIVASLIPARRASRVSPIIALKHE